jgi:hypothetical protein
MIDDGDGDNDTYLLVLTLLYNVGCKGKKNLLHFMYFYYFSRDINEDDFLQPITLVVRAIQYDNQDRYALATLIVSKAGTSLRELQFSKNEYSVSALENLPVNYVLLTVTTNKPRDLVSFPK